MFRAKLSEPKLILTAPPIIRFTHLCVGVRWPQGGAKVMEIGPPRFPKKINLY